MKSRMRKNRTSGSVRGSRQAFHVYKYPERSVETVYSTVYDMAVSEAKRITDARHQAKLDQIMIRPYKEEGQRIRDHAASAGESVQGYILDAVRDRMDREDQEKK